MPGLSNSKSSDSQETKSIPSTVNQRSARPLKNLPKSTITQAQQQLKLLGFNLGPADGIWGPRSAAAIRSFERRNGLSTANGFLSELNLHMLDTLTQSNRQRSRRASAKQSTGIKAKLDRSISLEQGPQLIFVDRAYDLYLKPNPYSERLVTLTSGTGIYVLSQQEGWFEVESESKQKGFIKAD